MSNVRLAISRWKYLKLAAQCLFCAVFNRYGVNIRGIG